MKHLIMAILIAANVWMVLAVTVYREATTPISHELRARWNYANASVSWNYFNGSFYQPIWNPANPSFVACSSFTGPNYAPEGAILNQISDTASYNPLPNCWNCHGSVMWGYNDSATGMAHANGSPMSYGE